VLEDVGRRHAGAPGHEAHEDAGRAIRFGGQRIELQPGAGRERDGLREHTALRQEVDQGLRDILELDVHALPHVGGRDGMAGSEDEQLHRGRAQPSAFAHSSLRDADAGVEWRVSLGVAARLRVPQVVDELREELEVVRLVDHDELLVLEAEGVEQELRDLPELLPDADVLVHHALPRLPAQEVPVRGLRERVHHQVGGPLGREGVDLLRGLGRPAVLGGAGEPPEHVARLEEIAMSVLGRRARGEERDRGRRLHVAEAAPHEHVGIAFDALDEIELRRIRGVGEALRPCQRTRASLLPRQRPELGGGPVRGEVSERDGRVLVLCHESSACVQRA
jgi:hypothetical protein